MRLLVVKFLKIESHMFSPGIICIPRAFHQDYIDPFDPEMTVIC